MLNSSENHKYKLPPKTKGAFLKRKKKNFKKMIY